LLSKPILPLPIQMIEPSFFTALVPPVGAAPLMQTRLLTALRAAITMSAVTVRADEEDRVAVFPATRPLQENRLIMCRRRHRRLAGVDNGSPVMSG
jgi:hypothetical protein